ncbi:MAG TPA: FAD-linked oxidoreductase, partial [Candidatus Dormibacteraeota bacterium]|nr:FAD-linked oxidoreductase [Candidatus Dormibacteraeota bacterium]
MQRRTLLKTAATLPLLALPGTRSAAAAAPAAPFARVRPGMPGWPTPAQWQELERAVGGALVPCPPLFGACGRDAAACADAE